MWASLAKNGAKNAGRHLERASQHGQHALAEGLHRLEVADHRRAHPIAARRPLVGAAQWRAGHDVGVVSASLVADEEALVEVGAGGLVHRGGALDALVHRQVADVVLVELEGQLVGQRQGVELARGREGAVDQRLGHTVAGDVEEADLLARAPDLSGDGFEPAGRATKRRRHVDHRDRPARLLQVLHRHGLEDVHPTSSRLRPIVPDLR